MLPHGIHDYAASGINRLQTFFTIEHAYAPSAVRIEAPAIILKNYRDIQSNMGNLGCEHAMVLAWLYAVDDRIFPVGLQQQSGQA